MNPPVKDAQDVWLHFNGVGSETVTAQEWDPSDTQARKATKINKKVVQSQQEEKETDLTFYSRNEADDNNSDASSSDDDASTSSESSDESDNNAVLDSEEIPTGYYFNFALGRARIKEPSKSAMVLEYSLPRNRQSVLEIKQNVDEAMPSPGMYKER
jgi:hypothetical protein